MTDGFWKPEGLSATELAHLQQHGTLYGARADSEPGKLVLHERLDDSGRKIREWTGPKSAWMNDFKAPLQRQLFINNNQRSKQECEARANRMLAEERQIAQQIAEHGVGSFRVDLGA
ncbi:hypothetical protein PQR05_03955 [Paraburkholderia sediminicola]|uniref:hypothetical protein n=1 Tax=Paraburkholderia sediminicola TaxID=458836 RepID=UPI0038BA5170